MDQPPFQDDLQLWRNGDGAAFDRLFAETYSEMCKVAARLLKKYAAFHPDFQEPGALVDAIWEGYREQKNREIESRMHFVNRAGMLMRNTLTDRVHKNRAKKRDHGRIEVPFDRLNSDC